MKLSVELEKWRIDRPDEWKMDEFARNAEKLEGERDALAAQIEAFGTLIHEAINGESAEPIATDGQITGYAISYEWLEKVGAAIDLPQQHLAGIRAQAGRDGFVKGYEYASYGSHPEDYADQYADNIRKGEVKL